MDDKRLREIKNRLDRARASYPTGKLPAYGDLQALQDCVDEISRLKSIIAAYTEPVPYDCHYACCKHLEHNTIDCTCGIHEKRECVCFE